MFKRNNKPLSTKEIFLICRIKNNLNFNPKPFDLETLNSLYEKGMLKISFKNENNIFKIINY